MLLVVRFKADAVWDTKVTPVRRDTRPRGKRTLSSSEWPVDNIVVNSNGFRKLRRRELNSDCYWNLRSEWKPPRGSYCQAPLGWLCHGESLTRKGRSNLNWLRILRLNSFLRELVLRTFVNMLLSLGKTWSKVVCQKPVFKLIGISQRY